MARTRSAHRGVAAARLVSAFVAVVAACSASSKPPPGGELTGDGGPDAGSDVTRPDGGGDTGAGDARVDAPSDGPIPTPAQCPTGYAWAAGPSQVTDSIARLGGVTPIGLSAAWTETTGALVSDDREHASSSFGSPSVIESPPPAGARAALDTTGLIIVAVAAGGVQPVFWQRAQTMAKWEYTSSGPTPFDLLSSAVSQAGATWSEPAFGASGDRFFYLVTPGSGAPAIYESVWQAQDGGGAWGAGVALPEAELASMDATHRRRPTGASADDRTLFFFDEVTGVERGAWRDSPTSAFTHFEDIAVAPEATPSLDCSQLYYVSGEVDGGGGTGISVAQ
jgi:hypothetical protein